MIDQEPRAAPLSSFQSKKLQQFSTKKIGKRGKQANQTECNKGQGSQRKRGAKTKIAQPNIHASRIPAITVNKLKGRARKLSKQTKLTDSLIRHASTSIIESDQSTDQEGYFTPPVPNLKHQSTRGRVHLLSSFSTQNGS